MRVFINDPTGKLLALERQIQAEGDELVSEQSRADVSIGGNFELPRAIVEGTVPEWLREANHKANGFDLCVSKFFGDKLEFGTQTLAGVPLRGLVCEGMGQDVEAGFASRYVSSPTMDDLFKAEVLREFLIGLGYKGFVSILFFAGKVSAIEAGIPSFGLFNVIEGIRGKISKFFVEGDKLLESWTMSNLVSRWPYPNEGQAQKVMIDGLSKEAERHFFLYPCQQIRKELYTTGTKLGVCTAWEHNATGAAYMVQRTCKNIKMENLQYRTDAADVICDKWAKVEKLL